jgi:hypothetical protein
MALRETVTQFESTTSRITESVTSQESSISRELVVVLQSFDRLQQEFIALAEVLATAAAKSGASWQRAPDGNHPAEDAVAVVSVADLKDRLLRYLDSSMLDLAPEPTPGDVEF